MSGRDGTRRRGRRSVAALAAVLVILLVPATVAYGAMLWTLTASPLAVTTGTTTTLTLTATNADPLSEINSELRIGCVVLDVPGNFTVGSVAIAGSSTGTTWGATLSGNQVKVRTPSGGDRLRLFDWVRFKVTATAMSSGSLTWNARAYRDQSCSSNQSLLGVPLIVAVTGPAVTPTPSPTPKPTPKPKPKPTPKPTPTPRPTRQPTPAPTPTTQSETPVPTPTPRPNLTEVTPRPSASARPDDSSPTPDQGTSSALPSPTPSAGAPDLSPGGTAGGPILGGPPQVWLAGGEESGGVAIDPFASFASAQAWFVPAAAIGGPGLLVILVIALQLMGAAAWVPAVRRLRGDDRRRRT